MRNFISLDIKKRKKIYFKILGFIAILSFTKLAYSKNHAELVRESEYKANLKTCLDGRYPYSCKHKILSKDHAELVRESEYKANLKTCLDGRYPYSCKHKILSKDHAELVRESESKKTPPSSVCAENGSCYGDISSRTGKSKRVHVKGYYRKNGTYVRGHYRSK